MNMRLSNNVTISVSPSFVKVQAANEVVSKHSTVDHICKAV